MRLRFGNGSNSYSLIVIIAIFFLSQGLTFAMDNKPDGGIIATSDNTNLCIGDGIPDIINASVSGSIGDSSIWLLTNQYNVILRIQDSPIFSFGGLDVGQYHIIHIGYDEFIVEPNKGINIKKLRGWFDLSNKIVVSVVSANGGFLTTTHNQSLTICVDDGFDDLIDVRLSSAKGDFQGWLITDQNGNILALPSGPPFNFEGTGAGICLIWHYSAIGSQPSLSIGQNASALSGCSDLSNSIQVIRETNCGINPCDVIGGSISTVQGLTELTVCVDDGLNDDVQVLTVGGRGDRIFLVTDTDGNILATSNTPSFNFEGQGAGVCVIWSLSFTNPVFGIVVGENVAGLQGCYELSNAITVTREVDCAAPVCDVSGGNISIDMSDATVCVDDGLNDNIQVSLVNNVGSSTWVATDEDGVILALQAGSTFNFEGRGAGRCQIWHLSTFGDIEGAEIGQRVTDITGCFSLSNSITIIRQVNCGVEPCDVEGGNIMTTDGLTQLTLCVDDSMSDMVSAVVSGNTGSSTWIVTDMNGNILLVMNDASFDFEGTGAGECQIWHLSLQDPIAGLGVGQNVSGLDGCLDLSNPITVLREVGCGEPVCDVDGGAIVLQDGTVAATVCVDDNIDDQLTAIVSGSQGASSLWVVTDPDGNILETTTDGTFNFEGIAAGTCLIWNLSFEGTLTGTSVGDNASDIVGCHDLSNPITITRQIDCGTPVCDVAGGTIISSDNQTELTVCVDDGVNSVITASVSGNSGSSSWLVTDAQGVILLIQNDTNFGFEGAGIGMCQIWHISLTGMVDGFGIGQNVADLKGCFDLSNPITVTRRVNCSDPPCVVVGGNVTTTEGATALTLCVDDGIDDIVSAQVTGNAGSSTYVVTNQEGTILIITNDPVVNFEGTGAGVCELWHLSLEDPLTGFGIGQNAADIVGCFEFSNPIMITREINCGVTLCDVEGGSIMTADGGMSTSVCVDDGVADGIDIMLAANTGTSTWIVTDDSGTILLIQNGPSFNFEGAGAGLCNIWHVSSDGPLEGLVIGQNASQITGCFDLSNPIQVTRRINCGQPVCNVIAGSIALETGDPTTTVCTSDNEDDIVEVILTGNTGASTYLVTDAQGNILEIQNTSTFDFTSVPAGTCFIYHMSLQDPVTGFGLGQNISGLGGCFQLSNRIEVIRIVDCGVPVCEVNAGSITLADGSTSISLCLSDDISDDISVILSGNTGASTYVVTDTEGIILDIQNDAMFNFTAAGAGLCYVYHISVQDPITGFGIGLNINGLEGCFQLSNRIEVTRIVDCGAPVCEVNAGSITLAGGSTATSLCLSDDMSDEISVVLSGNTGASTYLVTDTEGNILDIQNGVNFNFEVAGTGICYIYHMSLQDPITGFGVGLNINGLSGCFQLSNRIEVTRIVDCGPPACDISSGSITLASGETSISICVADNESDNISVLLTGNTGASTYIVTDANGVILEIQNEPDFNFDGVEAGVCFIYHMSLQDPITGFVLGQNIMGLGGCFQLSNTIQVIREDNCAPPECNVSGGSIAISDGETSVTVCADDGEPDILQVVLTGNSGASTYIVTDAQGVIINIQNEAEFNFEGAGAGTCLLYHASILDPLTGFILGGNISDIEGCISLSNAITVNREVECGPDPCDEVIGGMIATAEGETELTVCVTDGIQENIELVISGNSGARIWIVTNTDNILLSVQTTPVFSFEGLESGQCRIYSISLIAPVEGLEIGANMGDVVGCTSLSNAITVNRITDCGPGMAMGGSLSLANGTEEITVCVDDGVNENISPTLTGDVGSVAWVVTDTAGIILNLQTGPPFNFEGLGAGVCLIWHVSSFDTLGGVVIGGAVADITGDFALSNSIRVTRQINCGEMMCTVVAGSIATSEGRTALTVCTDDGLSDVLDLQVSGNSGEESWVQVDNNGVITGISENSDFELEGSTPGGCLIYHISLQGPISRFAVGESLDSLGGCFALSNSFTIIKENDCGEDICNVDGGQIATSDGSTELTICADDGLSDVINVLLTGSTGLSSYIVTDTTGLIIATQATGIFDFEGAGGGVCLIWHVSARDSSFSASTGINADELTGCFDLSNPITVIRNTGCAVIPCEVEGGSIMISDSLMSITICVDDEVSDLTNVMLAGNIGLSSFLITNEAGVVLAVQDSSTFEFEGLGGGICLIWQLSTRDSSFTVGLGSNINDLDGCFDLSNPITVNRNTGCKPFTCDDVQSGTISYAASDGDNLSVCIDDGMDENIEVTREGHVGGSLWIITDANGLILDVQNEAIFNFEGSPTGICIIRHLGILDPFSGLIPGRNIADAEGCFKMSNQLTVDRRICDTTPCEVEGGVIATTDDLTDLTICANDGVSDMFSVDVTENQGISSWLVTDTTGVVLMIQENNIFDFEGAGLGVCLVWHISTRDSSYTVSVGQNANDLMGCFDLSNPIRVNRETDCINLTCDNIAAGTISILGGQDSVTVCVNDGQVEELNVQLVNDRGGSIWVITDVDGVILELQNEGPFNFEGVAAGTCLIRHLGLLDPITGLIPGNNIADVEGCVKMSNAITVIRESCQMICNVDGGTITTSEGLTEVRICADDRVSDSFDITLTGNIGPNSIYILADSTGSILGFQLEPVLDLEGAGQGLCFFYHASLRDSITGAELEQNINDFSTCISISNPIRIFRDGGDFEGGMIADADGNTETTICGTDGMAAEIDVTLTGDVGDFSVWLMTDLFDNILFFYDSAPPFQIEDGDLETYRLYHMSYSSNVLGLQDATNIGNILGCFDLSNPYVINMQVDCDMTECAAVGGAINSGGETEITVCVDDDADDNISVSLTNSVGDSSLWLITDTLGMIIALPSRPPFNFEGVDEGVCLIWNVSYIGALEGVAVGANANNDISGCFALSNPIRVTREIDCGQSECTAEGGLIVTDSGSTSFTVCVDDGEPDELVFTVSGAVGDSSVWVVTDTMGVILSTQADGNFNFEGIDAGTCLVWHLSYNDTITGAVIGMNAAGIVGCSDLSEPITIVRQVNCVMLGCTAEGGSIMTSDSLTMVTVCTDDMIADSIAIVLSGAVGDSTVWVVTDTAGVILQLSDEAPTNFETVPAGICRVWHLSYNDSIIGATVGLNASDITGCANLSNFITVVREEGCAAEPCLADGGIIMLSDSTDQLTICAGDGIENIFSLMIRDTIGSGDNWITTDTLGNIIAVSGVNEFNFESAGGGVCYIYNLSFISSVSGTVVGDNISDLEGCFDLSNRITVIRETDCMECVAVGGVITLDDGFQSAMLCTGDGNTDVVNVNLTTENGDSSTYIVTDTSGLIIDIQTASTFEFDGAGPGICQIWHLSSVGALTGVVVGQNVDGIEGCSDLSNPIMITRNDVDGGTVNLVGGDTEITICVNDSIPDRLSFENTSTADMQYVYLLTDASNRFLVNSGDSSDFENIGIGMCRVYGLSYTGTLNFANFSQMDVTTLDFTECFDLSDNFIEVTRVQGDDCPDGSFRYGEVNFTVAENPVIDDLELQINSENLEGKVWVEVRSINGQLMKSVTMDLTIGQMTKTIDVSDVANGFYFVTIRNNVISKNERIIIQR